MNIHCEGCNTPATCPEWLAEELGMELLNAGIDTQQKVKNLLAKNGL